MNCTCITAISEKIHEANPTFNRKNVESVDIQSTFTFKDGGMDKRTYSNAILEIEGQMKKPTITVIHTFCPFCGVRQVPEETVVESRRYP